MKNYSYFSFQACLMDITISVIYFYYVLFGSEFAFFHPKKERLYFSNAGFNSTKNYWHLCSGCSDSDKSFIRERFLRRWRFFSGAMSEAPNYFPVFWLVRRPPNPSVAFNKIISEVQACKVAGQSAAYGPWTNPLPAVRTPEKSLNNCSTIHLQKLPKWWRREWHTFNVL